MKTIALLEFRKETQSVLHYVQKGQSVLLTYRGKPVARLEPVTNRSANSEDPFYFLDQAGGNSPEKMSDFVTQSTTIP